MHLLSNCVFISSLVGVNGFKSVHEWIFLISYAKNTLWKSNSLSTVSARRTGLRECRRQHRRKIFLLINDYKRNYTRIIMKILVTKYFMIWKYSTIFWKRYDFNDCGFRCHQCLKDLYQCFLSFSSGNGNSTSLIWELDAYKDITEPIN